MLRSKNSWLGLAVLCFIVFEVNTTTSLTNAYAKVAKWGMGAIPHVGEGRSNNGQSFYTQSSDVKLRGGQNLKNDKENKEKVVYHYSMPVQGITSKVNKAPGFQDRFNPPPAFQFGDSKRNVADDHDYNDHNHDQHQGPVYSPPKPQASYDSPVSSYNPIASGIPDVNKFVTNGPKYPPFSDNNAPPAGFKGPLSNVDANGSDYDDNDNDKSPGENGGDNGGGNSGYQYNPPTSGGYQYNPPSSMLPTPVSLPLAPTPSPKPQIMTIPQPLPAPLPINNHYKFPSYVYDTNDTHNDFYLDHPPTEHDTHHYEHDHGHDHEHNHNHDDDGDNQDQGQDPGLPDNLKMQMPQDYHDSDTDADYNNNDHDHDHDHDHKHSIDDLPEYVDHDPSIKGKFNHFPLWSNLYDDHHDHFVYHPVTTTTTPPPPPPPEPEDENRVNKGHYSYYYLGRKLYYVPLYFSVYFIIYITVLILKSIARHKVNFVHELDNVNKARSLGDSEGVRREKIDELAEQTTRRIVEFKRRYIAM